MDLDLEAMSAALMGGIGANDTETEPRLWLDTGYIPLNRILSGKDDRGFPCGRMIEIAGPPASGKTLIATAAMIAAQRAGGIAIFVDWERSFNATFAQMLGLDVTFPRFVYKRSETWEEGNSVALKTAQILREKKLLDKDAPIVVVCDSIAAAVPKSMLFDSKTGKRREIDEFTMNDTTALARVTSTTLKVVNQLVGDMDVTAIYLNQIRTKPGVVYGDPRTTPGGSSMEFYASQRLFTGRKKVMTGTGDDKEFTAALIGMETVKNKLNRPFQNVELRLAYDPEGRASFDYTTGYIDELLAAKKLETKGNYILWDGKQYYKAQLAKKIDAEGLQPELVKLYLG